MLKRRKIWDDDPFADWSECEFERYCYKGGGGNSAPAAPDPAATAAAQGAANEQTARLQGQINHPNMTTPLGTQTWTQNGDQYSGTVTLSPEQQQLYNTQTATQQGLYGLANNQIPRVQTAMASGLDTSGLSDPNAQYGDIASAAQRTGDQIYQAGVNRLQPQFKQQTEDTAQNLANRGIPIGSDAYGNVTRQTQQSQNDALSQLAANAQAASANQLSQNVQTGLGLRGQGLQERSAIRSLPMSDIQQLMGAGGGAQFPQFQPTAASNVAPTDVIGPAYNSYQGQLNAYNQQQQNSAAQTSGLYGLAGNAATAAALYWSDRRLKTDISPVGELRDGTPVYTFRYRNDPARVLHMGVMADEVRNREAVHEIGGYAAVDYARL